MPQSQKTLRERTFRRMTFQILRDGSILKTHTLLINPEEYAQDEPARVEEIKTFAGVSASLWGRDLMTFNMQGVTGYHQRVGSTGQITDGFQAMKELRDDIYRYFLEPEGTPMQLRKDSASFELRYYNWEDGEYYAILPKKFSLKRSKSRPLLYAYDFSFTALYPLNKPNKKVLDAVLDSVYRIDLREPNLTETILTIKRILGGSYFRGQLLFPRDIKWEEAIGLTDMERLPQSPEMNTIFPRIISIITFADNLLRQISSGTVTASTTELREMLLAIREANTSLSNLPIPPLLLKRELRKLQSIIGSVRADN